MLAAAPNACNLCHLDRSLGWTLDALSVRAGTPIDGRALPGRPDLSGPAGQAWLESPVSGVRLIGAAAYGRSRLGRAALPALLAGLDDDLAYVRAWTQLAVEAVLGRGLTPTEYDARASRAARRAQIERLAR
jgi:hypothetical protein